MIEFIPDDGTYLNDEPLANILILDEMGNLTSLRRQILSHGLLNILLLG